MKLLLLHGEIAPDAPADEQDALVQVGAIREAAQALGHEVRTLPVTLDLEQLCRDLETLRPEMVFNLVESLAGNGALIHLPAAVLDWRRQAYTGAHAEALLLTSNKLLAKACLTAAGIATPQWIEDTARAEQAEGGLWIVKSVWEHASIGLDDSSVQRGGVGLAEKLRACQCAKGGRWFAERYVEGRELNVALLQDGVSVQVLPIAEIRFEDFPDGKPRIVDYRAKWVEDSFEYAHTVRHFPRAPQDATLLESLAATSLRCWALFALRGYARVDFRVDAAGKPWVLEVNANPCLSPDSGFFAAAADAGIDYPCMVARIVEAAIDAKPIAAASASPTGQRMHDAAAAHAHIETPELTFRAEAKEGDAAAVERLVRDSGFFNAEETEVAVELVQERLQRGPASGYHFLFAEHDSALAGYACYGPVPGTRESFDLYWIVVGARLQGRGIGKQLLARSEAAIAALGGRRIYIETSGRDQYKRTRAFYEHCGYHEAAVLKDFYARGDPKIIYVRTLAPS